MLASLDHLSYLRITIERMCLLEQHGHPVDASVLLKALRPLKSVSVRDFTVEIPEDTGFEREELGEVPFRLIERLIFDPAIHGPYVEKGLMHHRVRLF